jgi:outer membrane receptor for ferrienterochelin and colicin
MPLATGLRRSLVLLVAVGAFARRGAAAPAAVDPFEEPDESQLFRAEQEVVTVASRYAQTVRQAPSIVTVIRDTDIRSRGYRTLSDVLRDVPGVYLSVAKEGRDLAYVRGVVSSDNNKFLLLLDGVPWYDGVYTHAWIDDYLPLANVKQVEIIKGPGSAIYGTNAFAGVVNVVTYRAADLQGGFVRAEAGSAAWRGFSVVHADQAELGGRAVEVQALVRVMETDGDGLDVTPRGRSNVSGTDPRRAINAGFGLRRGRLALRLDTVDYQHTYFTNEQDDAIDVLLQGIDNFNLSYHNTYASLRFDQPLGRFGRLSPFLSLQAHDNPGQYAWINDAVVDGESAVWSTTLVETEKRSNRYSGGVEAQLHPSPAHTTVAGVGAEVVQIVALDDIYYDDRSHDASTPSPFHADPTAIWDAYGFLQHTWTAAWWLEATGGLRLDQHLYFGNFVSPRVGLLLIPGADTVIKLLYGRAFRAPTARELLVEVAVEDDGSNQFTSGNIGLEPEKIDTIEGELSTEWLASGSEDRTTALQLRIAGFYSKITDEIGKVSTDLADADPVLGDDYYFNRGGSDVVGGELELGADLTGLELAGSYSITQAVDRDTGFLQYEFPPHMAHARVTWAGIDGVRLSLMAEAVGRRPRVQWTDQSKLQDGDPYGLLHGAISTDFGAKGGDRGRWRADLSARNLLDKQYATLVPLEDANAVDDDGAAKYPTDIEAEGRTFVVGVERSF